MPNILPVSDLRNYNEVLKNCQIGEPRKEATHETAGSRRSC